MVCSVTFSVMFNNTSIFFFELQTIFRKKNWCMSMIFKNVMVSGVSPQEISSLRAYSISTTNSYLEIFWCTSIVFRNVMVSGVSFEEISNLLGDSMFQYKNIF